MSRIVETAKPAATKLIKGEQIDLGLDEQLAVANWVALAAMMADLNAKSPHKLPPSDLSWLFAQRTPPPHWYIGIGYYLGPEPVAFNHNVTPVVDRDPTTRKITSGFVCHVLSTIIGRFFALCQTANHNGKPISALKPPTGLYANHLAPIWPRYQISFPPPPAAAITGAFTLDGGMAREIATRFQTQLAGKLAAMGMMPG